MVRSLDLLESIYVQPVEASLKPKASQVFTECLQKLIIISKNEVFSGDDGLAPQGGIPNPPSLLSLIYTTVQHLATFRPVITCRIR